jgi:hypothetical protein
MIDKPDRKSVSVGLRITPTLKAAIDKAALREQRTVASMVEKILFDYLRENGYLKK